MPWSGNFEIANMPFKAFRENKILAKIFEFIVDSIKIYIAGQFQNLKLISRSLHHKCKIIICTTDSP